MSLDFSMRSMYPTGHPSKDLDPSLTSMYPTRHPSMDLDLRNMATVLVARDKRRSNADKLAKSMNEPKLLWQIANAALGKNRPTLPISIRKPYSAMTVGNAKAAAILNRSYVTKIRILRDRTVSSALATSEKWTSSSKPFSFSFANAGKIVKTIRGLKPTGAQGVDTILVEVFKKGIEVLAAPIAHMCNVSFATGRADYAITENGIKR
jgi:hypothetical protein